MAITFMEGFDLYPNTADFKAASGCGLYGSASLVPNGGRYGRGCINLANASSGLTFPLLGITTGTTWTFAWAYYHTGGTGATYSEIFSIFDVDGSRVAGWGHNGNGNTRAINRSGSTQNSAGTELIANTWHWVEVQVVMGTTTSNGSISVRVNTVPTVTFSATFTTNVVVPSMCRFQGSANGGVVDDFIVCSGVGNAPTTFFGDSYIDTVVPDAAGTNSAWTANTGTALDAVRDTRNAPNDDTNYIASTTAAQKSDFNCADITGTSAAIHAVQGRFRARRTGEAARTMRGFIRNSASEVTGDTIMLADTYRTYRGALATVNPNGNVAWTDATANTAQVGVELIS